MGLSFSSQAGLSTDHKHGRQYQNSALMSPRLNELRDTYFVEVMREEGRNPVLAKATPGKKTKFLAEMISSASGVHHSFVRT